MKKLFAVVVIAGMVGYANAKSLKGSLGLGIGWTPTAYMNTVGFPGPDFVMMKFGFSEKLTFEPLLNFNLKSVSDGTSESGSKIELQFLVDYLFREHKKTNLYLKGGIGFMIDSPLYDTPYSSAFTFGITFGIGIEHFVSDYFSIGLDAASGFYYMSQNDPDGNITSFNLGNNQINLYLMWYY